MAKTTSFVLSDHFDGFVAAQVGSGRHASASDVVREGLRLVEERDARLAALNAVLDAGLASPDAADFSWDRVRALGTAAARG